MNKRGQFFLVAAMLIILIVMGLNKVSTNISFSPESREINELSKDLSRESYTLTEYGVYNEKDVESLLTNFTGEQIGDYFLQKTDDANIIFLYGNKDRLTSLQYNKGSQGKINLGTTSSWKNFKNFAKIKNINKEELSGRDNINVELELSSGKKANYNFKLKENELFYFVIVKENKNEVIVNTGN
ncbi:hypothetical protein CMI42_04765 [Candidatus Pacearchaeota archaeon]|nr:hypothetical protein [Candidatus Pacearchaeota archaeon]|tara:strand:+ start:408 stop:962 length:555 start_codon:yes stop_codon:yes gene_type:complete